MKHKTQAMLATFLLVIFSLAVADLIAHSMKKLVAGENWYAFGVIVSVGLVVLAEMKLKSL